MNAFVEHHKDNIQFADEKRCQLDRLYQGICDHPDALLREVGLKIAA